MNDKNELKPLQYYRHNVLNELQLVQGYLYLDDIQKAKQKVQEWISSVSEEGKLFLTNASNFIVWVIMFNHTYDNIRLTYKIETTTSLNKVDQQLVEHCKKLMQVIDENCNHTLCHAFLHVRDISSSKIMFTFRVEGDFTTEDKLLNQLKNMRDNNDLVTSITSENEAIMYTWTFVI